MHLNGLSINLALVQFGMYRHIVALEVPQFLVNVSGEGANPERPNGLGSLGEEILLNCATVSGDSGP